MTATPHTIGRKQTLQKAHELMREHGIRHLPVLDGGKLVGIVSQRDLEMVETLDGVDPGAIAVEEAMTSEPYVVAPLAKLDETVRVMARKKFGSAVVADKGRVVGIFTAVDALAALAWVLDLLDED
ncbi:MAG: CBS domain-containing protein [Deltaproteobacteria bacterium]|nr:CBS domain-containing protein [Deltaproteobacteria bacterium]